MTRQHLQRVHDDVRYIAAARPRGKRRDLGATEAILALLAFGEGRKRLLSAPLAEIF